MRQRAITTGRQLGAAIHDARIQAGMTQAALATRAGVSRKWLIGLEQGARTGAELGKVFEVLRALNLSIQLHEEGPEIPASQAPQSEAATPTEVLTAESAGPRRTSAVSTREALKALETMRQATAPSRTALEAMRQATQIPPGVMDAIRQATSSTSTLEAMRQATQIPPGVMDAIRQATSSTSALEAMRQATQISPSTPDGAISRNPDEDE